jgi:hypothetical protein
LREATYTVAGTHKVLWFAPRHVVEEEKIVDGAAVKRLIQTDDNSLPGTHRISSDLIACVHGVTCRTKGKEIAWVVSATGRNIDDVVKVQYQKIATCWHRAAKARFDKHRPPYAFWYRSSGHKYFSRHLTSAISGGVQSARRLLTETFKSRLQDLQAA